MHSLLFLLPILAAAGLAVFVYRLQQANQRARRPERLCLVCEAVHQPERIPPDRFRCPTCSAPGPVLLDSSAAEAHRQARAAEAAVPTATLAANQPGKPAAKVWTPRPKDDITRYG